MVVSGNVVTLDTLIQPRFEPEIAVSCGGMSRRLERGDVWQQSARRSSPFDVLDSVWRDYRFSLALVVADNTIGRAFVLGDHAYDAIHPVSSKCVSTRARRQRSARRHRRSDRAPAMLADDVRRLRAGQVMLPRLADAAVEARPGLLELAGPNGVSLTSGCTVA